MELKDGLTILIPTYNRKDRLLNTLRSISSQGHIGEYKIVIVDNSSNYDVKGTINEEFSGDFNKSVTVHRWFFNTGMSTNISIAFEFVDTKWCWFISDDDEILQGALQTIINDTKRYGNCAAIKYSINSVCDYDNSIINNVVEWAQYYMDHPSGDKGYLSMLYNISVLCPFLQELTVHSYSYLSFWIPVIRALNETDSTLVMSSDTLFKYKSNNDGWSSSDERFLNTLLGIRTLFDSRYSLPKTTFLKFKQVFSSDLFRSRKVILRILSLPKREDRQHYYHLLKYYLTGGAIEIVLTKLFYHFIVVFNVKPSSINRLLSIKRRG